MLLKPEKCQPPGRRQTIKIKQMKSPLLKTFLFSFLFLAFFQNIKAVTKHCSATHKIEVEKVKKRQKPKILKKITRSKKMTKAGWSFGLSAGGIFFILLSAIFQMPGLFFLGALLCILGFFHGINALKKKSGKKYQAILGIAFGAVGFGLIIAFLGLITLISLGAG